MFHRSQEIIDGLTMPAGTRVKGLTATVGVVVARIVKKAASTAKTEANPQGQTQPACCSVELYPERFDDWRPECNIGREGPTEFFGV